MRTCSWKYRYILATEAKFDSSFPSPKFHMHGYTTPYRHDRNANGGGLLLCVREDIPSRKIDNVDFDNGLEALLIYKEPFKSHRKES